MGKGLVDENQYGVWLWENIQKRGWTVSFSVEKEYHKDLFLGFTSNMTTKTKLIEKYDGGVNVVDEPIPKSNLSGKPSLENSMTLEHKNSNDKAAKDKGQKIGNVSSCFITEEERMNKEAKKGNGSEMSIQMEFFWVNSRLKGSRV